ncbi:MAG: glycosyltransferase family 4 protein [Ignavibacterium sp.]|nr:glycosyltransferase family 4 protein [Ignavibacterium sp.]
MKKLLFSSFSGFPNEHTGGPNKIIYQLINKLPTDLYKIEFASKHGKLSFPINRKDEAKINLDRIREKLFKRFFLYRKFFTSSFYLKKFFEEAFKTINHLIQTSDYDILNAHDIRTIFFLNNSKKIILSIHSNGSILKDMSVLYGTNKRMQQIYDKFGKLELEALEKADLIVFPSQAAKKMYFEDINKNIPEYKVKVIYTGIDVEKINSINLNENFENKFGFLREKKIKILNVGNHIKVKNVDKVIKVLAALKSINLDFIFINIGTGPMTNSLKELIKELNLEKNVIMIPFLVNEDVIRMMKVCDVYISLSERVIFDFVILEALACGLKVIASDDGGNREIIQNNFNGFLVNINDTERILDLILKQDLENKDNISKSLSKFTIQNMINEYIKIYEGKFD